MKILAIETSCDDTGIAILEITPNKNSHERNSHEFTPFAYPKILADFVSSQIKIHAPWGGVVPMLAKREHQRNLAPLLKEALKKSKLLTINNKQLTINNKNLKYILHREPELLKKLLPFLKKYQKPDFDYIAVTVGPGLEPALWVGINFARALSYFWNIPLIAIDHIEGHICANPAIGGIGADNKMFPAMAIVVSGGHTQLILVKAIGKYKIIGETRDDAAGEAFDKVAKMLNLGYPGGPAISQVAKRKSPSASRQAPSAKRFATFPRPMLNSGDFDFSFSGLKTAVLYTLQKMTPAQIKKQTPTIAAEFQQAVIDVLIAKTMAAAKKYNVKTIILAGGVAANQALRQTLTDQATEQNLAFLVPSNHLCADNATMIALAAYYQIQQSRAKKANWRTLKAQANLRIS